MRRARVAREGDVVVEPDEVHHRRERHSGATHQAEVAVQVLGAVALVLHRFAHPLVDLGQQFPQRHVGPDREAYGNAVGQHPGRHTGGGPHPAGHGQPDDDVPRARQTVRVQRHGGEHETEAGDAGARGRRLQLVRSQERKQLRSRNGPVGGSGGGRPVRTRPSGQLPHPVLTIRGTVLGLAIVLVVLDQCRQRAEGTVAGFLSLRQCRVHLGHPPGDECVAEGVDGRVMVGVVPPVPLRSQPEQRVAEQRAGGQVHGPGQVGGDPRAGGGLRVGFVADVDGRQRPGQLTLQDLDGAVLAGDEAHP
ncbi:hypothetical protein GCM10010270_01560 [Streptomyces violaceus]|nr:hypothetical protein GCM10010270_01560 [Streptomyces janthinus]